MSDADEIKFDHLSDREILILACRDLRDVKQTVHGRGGHGARLSSLENWRIGLTAGWAAISGVIALALAYMRANPRTHP